MIGDVEWPKKEREVRNFCMDSTIWDGVAFRDGDIVIGSYSKAGTTWTQQLAGQLLTEGDPEFDSSKATMWVELVFPPREEKLRVLEEQSSRRCMKTHLPVDALSLSPKAKYIYLVRDGRDVVWSFYNHHVALKPESYEMFNGPTNPGPPFEPPVDDVRKYWRDWMDRDGHPLWPFWEHVRGWWSVRHLPNVKLLHFNDLKKDFDKEARGLADFLGIPIKEDRWADIVDHCSLEWMRKTEKGGGFMEDGAFFRQGGVNGRWRDALTGAECEEYERRAVEELGEQCAHWLATGERLD
ncbi:unnamed protein product [Ostreobium quekettii]|uniref:Sulfotransferase n=1 Tax=Ostreobium quekettii TaxID=121088 RepID=A0A8S1J326_9CHLO|nr:unnamed protein product [Ostreobium quekettii]